jgi:hypothetical protein
MPARRLDAEIDRLYQLAPDAFTAARNALAKAAGSDAPAVKRLVKPPIAAWAVNQVYWQRRDVYDALITAATELRHAHKAVLSGKGGDVRGPARAHESAVDAALKAALSLLEANGQPATDATRQAIATTLRALPADEPPGRLTRTLQPGGFEMLAGLAIAGQPQRGERPASTRDSGPGAPASEGSAAPSSRRGTKPAAAPATFHRKTTHDTPARVDPKAAARAREAAAKAAREVREAEHTVRREEFEAARAAREAEKAARHLEQAREALTSAQRGVEEAEAAATEAARTKAAAEERAAAAERALEAARQRARNA